MALALLAQSLRDEERAHRQQPITVLALMALALLLALGLALAFVRSITQPLAAGRAVGPGRGAR